MRKAPAPDAPVRTPAQNWPALRRRLAATLCRANLCHQTFLGILCHQEFFSGRSVSPEWQPYQKKRFPNTGTQATIYWHSRKIPRRRGIYCSIYRGAAVYTAVYTAAFSGAAVYTGISPERHPTPLLLILRSDRSEHNLPVTCYLSRPKGITSLMEFIAPWTGCLVARASLLWQIVRCRLRLRFDRIGKETLSIKIRMKYW